MSYYPNQQQGGYPPYQGHSPAPPPQQGYGQPPNQYPPTNSPYPPQQQAWNQPPPMQNQPYAQQGYNQYGPPPGAPQQGWNQSPPGQYGAPPQQAPYGAPQYGAPAGAPPVQPYGAPPGQYGPPPGQPQYGAPPPNQYGAPPQPYGAPPPQQPPYGAPPGQFGPPTQPSPGYGPQQNLPMNVSEQVEGLHKAMKGFGTDEKALIKILRKQDPLVMNTILQQYNQRLMKDLVKDIEKETGGYFQKTLVAIARGPLMGDCYALYEAMKGLGTKEVILDDVLIGRSNADINAIKTEYQRLFGKPLESDLRSDLSAGTEQMFAMIVAARRNEDSVPVIPQQIEQDVTQLQQAIGNIVSKDATQACQILTSKNDAQLRAICQAYQQRYHKSLESIIKSKFSGHMEKALLLLLARANNRAASDAVQLEDSMAGPGTKDVLLVQRVVRAHWNRQYMEAVRAEYQKKYKKDLVNRIKGETSGDYERALVACVDLRYGIWYEPDGRTQPQNQQQKFDRSVYDVGNDNEDSQKHSADPDNDLSDDSDIDAILRVLKGYQGEHALFGDLEVLSDAEEPGDTAGLNRLVGSMELIGLRDVRLRDADEPKESAGSTELIGLGDDGLSDTDESKESSQSSEDEVD